MEALWNITMGKIESVNAFKFDPTQIGVNYYETTAYDSRKPRNSISTDTSSPEFNISNRWVRSKRLPHGEACGEYLSIANIEWVKQLNSSKPDPEYQHELEQPAHATISFSGTNNPRALAKILVGVSKYFAFFGSTGMIMLYYLRIDEKIFYTPSQSFLIVGAIFVLLPIVIIFIGNFLLKKNILPDINNIILDRRTGKISAPDQKDKPAPLTFSQLECYTSTQPNAVGSPDVYLYLGYPDRPEGINVPMSINSEWQRHIEWEFYQRFMDISKPLPDLPEYEPHRNKDPVTAEYDKRVGRPKDFWKNMDYEEAVKLKERSAEAARTFPWGKTRKEAIASGWKPSRVLPWED